MEASIINPNDIVSVEVIKNQRTYDIEVEDNHNFYLKTNTDKILVHNSGKTEFVYSMCIGYNLNYGWKTAFCSVEDRPNFQIGRKIVKKLLGYEPQERHHLDSKGYKSVVDNIQDNYFFIEYEDGYDLKRVLSKAEELVKRKGIKCLVIDPFNKIRLKESMKKGINDYTNDYLTELDTFARKHDILIIIVAHPNKMNNNGEEANRMPSFYDVKGGGEWFDMSPHGIVVHRDYDLKTVEVKILKVKFDNLGENEAIRYFKYNINNGRYVNVKHETLHIPPDYDNTNWVTKSENYNLEPMQTELVINDNLDLSPENNDLPF